VHDPGASERRRDGTTRISGGPTGGGLLRRAAGESLAPWADAVTTFDSVAIEHLSDVEWPDYWLAAYHASDPAVDALAAGATG
jgi:hypothetical protein